MDWTSLSFGVKLMLERLARWLYRGQRPNALARLLNRGAATVFARGVAPDYLVTLQVRGRRSGRTISLPLVMAVLDRERYLVSNHGANAAWVRNVKATAGRAVLRNGRTDAHPGRQRRPPRRVRGDRRRDSGLQGPVRRLTNSLRSTQAARQRRSFERRVVGARNRRRSPAQLHCRGRTPRDAGGHLRQLLADLRARLRPRLGHGRGRFRLRRSDAAARGLPGAPLGRPNGGRPGSLARTTRDSIAGATRPRAGGLRARAERDAVEVARAGRLLLGRSRGDAHAGQDVDPGDLAIR